MDAKLLELLEQIAKAIAAQFGSNCEVVLHELSGKSAYSSIVAIENGHVTGRKVGGWGTDPPMWCWSSWAMRTTVRRISLAI